MVRCRCYLQCRQWQPTCWSGGTRRWRHSHALIPGTTWSQAAPNMTSAPLRRFSSQSKSGLCAACCHWLSCTRHVEVYRSTSHWRHGCSRSRAAWRADIHAAAKFTAVTTSDGSGTFFFLHPVVGAAYDPEATPLAGGDEATCVQCKTCWPSMAASLPGAPGGSNQVSAARPSSQFVCTITDNEFWWFLIMKIIYGRLCGRLAKLFNGSTQNTPTFASSR